MHTDGDRQPVLSGFVTLILDLVCAIIQIRDTADQGSASCSHLEAISTSCGRVRELVLCLDHKGTWLPHGL